MTFPKFTKTSPLGPNFSSSLIWTEMYRKNSPALLSDFRYFPAYLCLHVTNFETKHFVLCTKSLKTQCIFIMKRPPILKLRKWQQNTQKRQQTQTSNCENHRTVYENLTISSSNSIRLSHVWDCVHIREWGINKWTQLWEFSHETSFIKQQDQKMVHDRERRRSKAISNVEKRFKAWFIVIQSDSKRFKAILNDSKLFKNIQCSSKKWKISFATKVMKNLTNITFSNYRTKKTKVIKSMTRIIIFTNNGRTATTNTF